MEKIKEMSIDLETYSDVDIKKSGVYKYAESENFEILLFAVSINGDDVIVYDLACGDVLPDEILDAIVTPTILNEFISRIEVHERDKKRAKQAIQHIGIYFNHIGRFENELTQLAEPTEQEIRQMREEIEEARKEKSRAYHRNYSREYRARNLEKRREYDRIKAREYRAKKKAQAAAALSAP